MPDIKSNKVLIQLSGNLYFDDVFELLRRTYELIVVPDDQLGMAVSENMNCISAIVLFDLTENTINVCDVVRNERFSNPLIPIACVGPENYIIRLPYGTRIFLPLMLDDLVEYLSKPLTVRILLVEDDEATSDFLSLTLSKYYKVDVAGDGNIGLDYIYNNDYDVIVLDVMLPGVNGKELFSIIHKIKRSTTVIVITAYDTSDLEFDFSLNGAEAYIQKPFDSNSAFRQQVIGAIVKNHNELSASKLSEEQDSRVDAWQEYRDVMQRYM